MRFIETSIFTKQVKELLTDESYRMLQSSLMLRPDAGAVIKGSGGLRKIRWSLQGEGKRGAIRTIYYFDRPESIYMIFMYKKTDQENLTPQQVKTLKKLVEENLL
ncbi:MAG: type II toxin-antitoxin system RelE/ParE family toxin [Deltaproteobacteria bacterium]|nr:type II toxin-antitoxin system RelE/ParE family toxin [Deltaproteobacteria bacterium]